MRGLVQDGETVHEWLERNGYKYSGITQRRVNFVDGEWKMTDDEYPMFVNSNGRIINVRERGGETLEVYLGHNLEWDYPSGKWDPRYGFSPTALSWPELEPIDFYLTCMEVDLRWADYGFFTRYEFVTPRWNAKTGEFNMVYGSCLRGFQSPDPNVKYLFDTYPGTQFLSIYFKPGKLAEPTAALVTP